MLKLNTLFLAGALTLSASVFAAGPVSIGNILPTAEGTTMTLVGTAAGWKDSWKSSAPNTFYLTDATGSMRVCIWPDDFAEVPPPVQDAIKKKGAAVRLSGEVAVFRERVELHVKDGASVSVIASGVAAPVPAVVPGAPVNPVAPALPQAPVSPVVPATR